jgi:hypothetical protein
MLATTLPAVGLLAHRKRRQCSLSDNRKPQDARRAQPLPDRVTNGFTHKTRPRVEGRASVSAPSY